MTISTIQDPAAAPPAVPETPSAAQTQVAARPQHLAGEAASTDVTSGVADAASQGGGLGYWLLKFGPDNFVAKGNGAEHIVAFPTEVVILGAASKLSRILFGQGSSEPMCQSEDGVAPDPFAKQPQSASCLTCPMARFNTAAKVGRQGKGPACVEKMRLAVVLRSDPSIVMRWDLPHSHRQALATYAQGLGTRKIPIDMIVTTIGRKVEGAGTANSWNVPTFTAGDWLNAEEWPAHKAAREEHADVIAKILDPKGASPVVNGGGAPAQLADQSAAAQNHAAVQQAVSDSYDRDIAF